MLRYLLLGMKCRQILTISRLLVNNKQIADQQLFKKSLDNLYYSRTM